MRGGEKRDKSWLMFRSNTMSTFSESPEKVEPILVRKCCRAPYRIQHKQMKLEINGNFALDSLCEVT